MRERWIVIGIGTLVLLGVGIGLLLFAGRAPDPPSGASAREIIVTRGTLRAVVEATGQVEAERRARLSFPVGGQIATRPVEVGDRVAANEPLVTLDRTELALRHAEAVAALAAAEAQRARATAPASAGEIAAAEAELRAARLALEIAERDLEALPVDERGESEEALLAERARAALEGARATLRRAIDGAGDEERALLDAQVEQAESRLALARAALESATLRAPFAATVIELAVAPGERVGPNQPVVTLADLETLIVIAEIDEVDVGRVEVGQPVTVTLDGFPAQPFGAEVERVAPASAAQRGATLYETLIRFDPARVALPIRLDMAADIRIRTADREQVLLLPLDAIRYAETQPFVVLVRDGLEREQPVELGAQGNGMVEVISGVDEGTRVLVP